MNTISIVRGDITQAGDLKAKYVIHTVGPRYGIDKNPEILLASAYCSSLDLALSHGCKSIAFPAGSIITRPRMRLKSPFQSAKGRNMPPWTYISTCSATR